MMARKFCFCIKPFKTAPQSLYIVFKLFVSHFWWFRYEIENICRNLKNKMKDITEFCQNRFLYHIKKNNQIHAREGKKLWDQVLWSYDFIRHWTCLGHLFLWLALLLGPITWYCPWFPNWHSQVVRGQFLDIINSTWLSMELLFSMVMYCHNGWQRNPNKVTYILFCHISTLTLTHLGKQAIASCYWMLKATKESSQLRFPSVEISDNIFE